MIKKKLYIMCGPAGSGKTTWVRCNAEAGTSAHISRDRIRFSMVREDEYYFSREDEVYDEFVREVVKALRCEWVDSVYADATHLSQKSRQRLIHEIDGYYPAEDYDIIAVVVKPELETCLAQNAEREGRARVPERVIRNMYQTFQHPLNDDIHYAYIYENDEIVYGEVK